jgi:hypothetical protein
VARPPLKLIEWEDSFNGNHRWTPLSELVGGADPFLIQTIGFEIARNEGRVTLAMNMQSEGDDPDVLDVMTIPLSLIRRERVLR